MYRILIMLLLQPLLLSAQDKEKINIWAPLQVLVGEWEGMGDGAWGTSNVEREYKFIMSGMFLQGLNKSIYEEQEKNPTGEVHDNLDLFSYDTKREKFVLRQFHAEGIVNQYILDSLAADGNSLGFVTESIENFGEGWRAKEFYKIISNDEFIEIFSLAAPGEDFKVYVENRFKRKK